MHLKGFILILNITYCFIFSAQSYAQIGRTEKKGSVTYNYYAETDNLHSIGKIDDKGKQGKWSYYTNKPTAEASIFQYFSYKNDTLTGPFSKFGDGKRITGSYLKGHYHGMIVIEDVIITGADTTFLPLEEGSYENGMKSSFFKEYKKGTLISEGGFDQDKKNGSWKFYDNSGESPVLQKKTYFKRDIKDGKEITYFEYDEEGNKIERRSEFFYKDNVKSGPFEIKLEGKTIEKGNYADGELSGAHEIFIKELDLTRYGNYFEGKLTGPVSFKDVNGAIMISGSYDGGKRNSTWKYVGSKGETLREESYNDDAPVDIWRYYDDSKLIREVKYENQSAKKIIEYTKGSDKPVAEFYINNVTGTYQEIEADLYYSDSSKTVNILVSVDQLKNPANLYEIYRKNANNPELIKKNGLYEFNLKGVKLIEGYFEMDKMDGKWIYYYNPDIQWEVTYVDNVITEEQFLSKSDKSPFKGTYEAKWPDGKMRFEFKIKDGLRHGKQLYYLNNGQVDKEEKYKEGIKG